MRAFLLIFLLSSCASSGFSPNKEKYVSVITFYDTVREVREVCKVTSKDGAVIGCHRMINNVHYIHSIKSRCVLDHELDHMFFGNFHDHMIATCKTRN